MGVDPATAVERLLPIGIDAVGFNCGTLTLAQYVKLAETCASVVKGRTILLGEPNAGKPELVEDKAVYKVTPEEFAAAAQKICAAGAGIIGGCCGTTPAHIEVMAKMLK